MITAPTKRDLRKAKFEKIAGEITDTVRAWRDRLGDHQFQLVGRAVQDDSAHSQYEPCMKPCCRMLIRNEGGINSHFPDAPQTKTLQFERTIRKGK